MRIGIDFDNTIVSYGASFARTAARLGMLEDEPPPDKTAVRAALRARPDGERLWTALQAVVYGPAIGDAPAFAGVHDFLATARRAGARVFLVSHKSQYAAADPGGCDLRVAARGWLQARGLIGPHAFDEGDVYFEATRAQKVARLAALAPTHVIDDLVEVFHEPAFPAAAERLLFAPGGDVAPGPWRTFGAWRELQRALFPDD